MKALLSKTLFISLLLSLVPSTMQAGGGFADQTLNFISSRLTNARDCFEPYLTERVENLSKNNPKTVKFLKSNPALAVVATGTAVSIVYLTTKNLVRSVLYCGLAAATLYAGLVYNGVVSNPSDLSSAGISKIFTKK